MTISADVRTNSNREERRLEPEWADGVLLTEVVSSVLEVLFDMTILPAAREGAVKAGIRS